MLVSALHCNRIWVKFVNESGRKAPMQRNLCESGGDITGRNRLPGGKWAPSRRKPEKRGDLLKPEEKRGISCCKTAVQWHP